MRSKAEKYGTEKYRYSKSVSVLKIEHSPKFRSLKCHTKILSNLLKLLAINFLKLDLFLFHNLGI